MPEFERPPKSLRATLWAILRLKCPVCRRGRAFTGHFAMNETCPVCGYRFEREQGYFFGAMYFSYGLGVILVACLALLTYLVLPRLELQWCALVGGLLYLPLTPAVFRYSRVIWMHFDQWYSPSD
jgi:uncharacterized protein (DUF983 family)